MSARDPVGTLPGVAEAVAGWIAVLVDGRIPRGSEVRKALALRATAVLACRLAVCVLVAYGADEVRKSVEMLQTELVREMVRLSIVTPRGIRRDHAHIDRC